MTADPQTPPAENRLWDDIQQALKAGGESYDFDVLDAGYALEELVKREQEKAVNAAFKDFNAWTYNRMDLCRCEREDIFRAQDAIVADMFPPRLLKLTDAIHEAAHEPERSRRSELIQDVVAFMRFRMGWTAAECRDIAERSGVAAEAWEELLYEADCNC